MSEQKKVEDQMFESMSTLHHIPDYEKVEERDADVITANQMIQVLKDAGLYEKQYIRPLIAVMFDLGVKNRICPNCMKEELFANISQYFVHIIGPELMELMLKLQSIPDKNPTLN